MREIGDTQDIRRVLFVAELSHAAPRVPSITRYLPQYGWECLVLTGTPGIDKIDCLTIETGLPDLIPAFKEKMGFSKNRGLQEQLVLPFSSNNNSHNFRTRSVRVLKALLLFPDQHRHWKRCLTTELVEQIRDFDPDIVVSTSSPVTAHKIACKLSKRLSIPWIADYRDLWSQNHNYPYGKLRRKLDCLYESRLIESAAAIVTVTPGWAKDLQVLHHREDVFVITNGFDPIYTPTEKNLDSRQFVLTLTGPVYPGTHNAHNLVEAVSFCINNGLIERASFKIKFFGMKDDDLNSLISEYELDDCIEQFGTESRLSSIAQQWSSDALLLFTWDTPGSQEHLPLRLFEYLATNTPIICTATRQNLGVIRMLDTPDKDFVCVSVEELVNALGELFRKWRLGIEPNMQAPHHSALNHSYLKKAEEFASLFSRVLAVARNNSAS